MWMTVYLNINCSAVSVCFRWIFSRAAVQQLLCLPGRPWFRHVPGSLRQHGRREGGACWNNRLQAFVSESRHSHPQLFAALQWLLLSTQPKRLVWQWQSKFGARTCKYKLTGKETQAKQNDLNEWTLFNNNPHFVEMSVCVNLGVHEWVSV
jgi:hypothetical protein